MKHIFLEDVGKRLPVFFGLLEGLVDNRSALQYIEAVHRYASSGSSHVKKEDIIKALKEVSIDEEGVQQGMQEGTMKLLSCQIARRFKVSPDSVHPMFAGLTTEQLGELGEMFVDAESLDEIRAWAEEKRLAKSQ